MKNNPKVSVFLSSYNHEQFLEDSINSILNQSFGDFELIIWDDCSMDSSWEIILSFDDPRIRPFRNDVNQCGGNMRQTIDKIAIGEYIAPHNSDDIWESTKLEKQVNFLNNNPNYLAVFTKAKIISESGEIYKDKDHHYYGVFDQPNRNRYEWLRYFFYNGNALCMPSAMFYKKIYQETDKCHGLFQLSDFSLWVQFCLMGEIHILNEELIRFRVFENESNWSGNKPSTRIRIQFEFLKILDHYKKISSIDEFLLIFPEAERYTNTNNPDMLFALGMTAVESGKNPHQILFGLNLLFDALNDPIRSNNLQIYQGFDKKKFIELTSKHDVFSHESVRSLKSIIRKLEQDLEKSKQEVLFYSLSKSWRITNPLRKVMNFTRKLLDGR